MSQPCQGALLRTSMRIIPSFRGSSTLTVSFTTAARLPGTTAAVRAVAPRCRLTVSTATTASCAGVRRRASARGRFTSVSMCRLTVVATAWRVRDKIREPHGGRVRRVPPALLPTAGRRAAGGGPGSLPVRAHAFPPMSRSPRPPRRPGPHLLHTQVIVQGNRAAARLDQHLLDRLRDNALRAGMPRDRRGRQSSRVQTAAGRRLGTRCQAPAHETAGGAACCTAQPDKVHLDELKLRQVGAADGALDCQLDVDSWRLFETPQQHALVHCGRDAHVTCMGDAAPGEGHGGAWPPHTRAAGGVLISCKQAAGGTTGGSHCMQRHLVHSSACMRSLAPRTLHADAGHCRCERSDRPAAAHHGAHAPAVERHAAVDRREAARDWVRQGAESRKLRPVRPHADICDGERPAARRGVRDGLLRERAVSSTACQGRRGAFNTWGCAAAPW